MKERSRVNPVLATCPVCKHNLNVVKLHCDHCDTTIEGDFTLSKFNYIETESLYFIEIFIKNRGNIKMIEKELNISYPTVKKMLDDVIVKLGYSLEPFDEEQATKEQEASKVSKASILEKERKIGERNEKES
ncbi:MAG: hypothetical protein CVV58_03480 [Tenericutes bacterium HGW-Tenericutes-3]|nr:MAG: hypothetical protein CVV58_03480 [Tenericutes bacterium HGW-Tenericutes-3]